MALSSEVKLAATFYNYREYILLRITLEVMGHLQPPNNVTVDNSMAHGPTQGTMVPGKSKATDMRFHLIKCQEAQGHIRYLWRRGKTTMLTITPIINYPNIIETYAQSTWHSTQYMNVSSTVGSITFYDYFILH